MKRDMDLVRDILLYTEKVCGGGEIKTLDYSRFEEFNKMTVYEHERLLREEGLLRDGRQRIGSTVTLYGLTWKGHDFIDSVRDPEIWAQTKDAANAVGGWTLSILSDLATGLIKTKIKKHTGVEL